MLRLCRNEYAPSEDIVALASVLLVPVVGEKKLVTDLKIEGWNQEFTAELELADLCPGASLKSLHIEGFAELSTKICAALNKNRFFNDLDVPVTIRGKQYVVNIERYNNFYMASFMSAYSQASFACGHQTMVEKMSDIITRYDINGRHVFCNQAKESATGIKCEDYLGKTDAEAGLPCGISKLITKGIRRVFNTKKEMSVEVAYQTPEGKKLYYHARLLPEFDEQGCVKTVLCFAKDITKQKETELKLQESEMKYRALEKENFWMRKTLDNAVSSGGVGIRIVDRNYSVLWSNESSDKVYLNIHDEEPCRIFTHTGGTCALRHDCILVTHLDAIFNKEKEIVKWEQLVIENGQQAWFKIIATPIRNKLLEVESAALFLIPITELKSTMLKLRESEERWHFALEGSGDGVWDHNLQEHTVYYSRQLKKLFGYPADEPIENIPYWTERLHPADKEQAVAAYNAHLNGESPYFSSEIRMLCRDGNYRWFHIRGKVVSYTPQGEPLRMVGTYTDISDRKESEKRILYLSQHDSLTGTYNRNYFEAQLEKLDAAANLPLGVLMIDANGLKLVNDIFGHKMGDKYLQRIAALLKSVVSKEELVARIGGDEFIIVLPNYNLQQLNQLAKRIKYLCKYKDVQPFALSLAIGAAVKEHAKQDIRNVFRQAEERMHRNKLFEDRSSRSNVVLSLRQSLEEKTHETQEHSRRLVKLAMRIGVILDLSEDQMDELKLLAFLHDIGKIAVPDSILEKPGALTPKEWEEMKQHCEIGYRIAISAPELSPIANSILSHHERWDGSGYPQGLKGKQIPLLARIIAVLDAYDTMTQGRIYKKEISEQEALAEIVRCAGTQFDPEVVTAFQKLMKPEILSQQLEQAREVLNQIVREKGLNSIEAMEQSRKVDHIINQISKLGKIEEADLTKQFSGFN